MIHKLDAGPLKGRALVALGVLVLSPDALFIRLIDTDKFTLMCGRGLFIIAAILLILAADRKDKPGSRPLLYRSELIAGLFYGGSSCLFVPALMYTSVASALVIIAASPLISALAGWLIWKEQLVSRTWVVAAGIIVGLGLIFSDGMQTGGMYGNIAAFLVACCLSGLFLTLHHNPKADNRRGMVVGAVMMVLVSAWAADLGSLDTTQWIYLALLSLIFLPAAFLLIGAGARMIPAAETSLLMLLESVFGPLLVFLIIGEQPTPTVLAGAALILGLLAWHQWPRKGEAAIGGH